MAQLVLGTVGAVVGGYFGGPQGAALGWSLGAMAGGAIDPQVTKNEGPRLADLSIQASTWGVMIPRVNGRSRLAGNVIWASPIRETKTTESEGGKGGPEVESTTYTYSVDLAISFADCTGGLPIIGVRRIWSYGNLIYSAGDQANIDTVIQSQKFATGFRVYTGNETQMPDPTIEAYKGVGNAPAYRGQAYIVFKNFQLADYGNRIPNFEFEVIRSGDQEFITKSFEDLPNDGPLKWPSPYRNVYENPVFYAVESNIVTAYQTSGEDSYQLWSTSVEASYIFSGSSDEEGVLVARWSGPTSVQYLVWIDSSGQATQITDYGYGFWALNPGESRFVKSGNVLVIYDRAGGAFSKFSIPSSPGYFQNFHQTILLQKKYDNQGFLSLAYRNGILYACRHGITAVELWRYDWETLAFIDATTYVAPMGFLSMSPGELYVTDGGRAIINGGSTTGVKPVLLEGGIATPIDMPFSGSSFFAMSNTLDLAVQWHQPARIHYYNLDGTTVAVASIIREQCALSGIDLDDVDLSGIDDVVDGYAIKRQGSARSNIEQLMTYCYADAVESENKLKFVKRGRAPVVRIPYEELGAHEFGGDSPDPLPFVRVQEVELPRRVTVNYINSQSDYLAGSEQAQRLISESLLEESVELAISMTPGKAAQIAEVLLYDAHLSRTTFSPETTAKYSYLEPTDVIEIEKSDVVYTMRLTALDDSGPVKKFSTVYEDAAVYVSGASGGSQNQSQSSIGGGGTTRAEYLDIPIIRDEDNDAGFYVAMTGLRDAWRGATLYKSFDRLSFTGIGSVFNSATIGYAKTVLGDWTGGNFFDESNTVDVVLYRGELASATADQILNNANCAVLGNEIIQFKNAILVGAGRYRLSGLLRARRGTEQHKSTHVTGERFVLMTVAGTLRPDAGASDIGAIRYYKPVSIGQKESEVQPYSFTNAAVGMKPYAPVHLSGGKQVNGDFLIGWTRRGRLGQTWRNNVDVPIGESGEAYEVEVMSGATVKRTIASATPAVTYTASMQTADFGGAQSTITVRIYQISSIVGRGFPATKTY